MTRIINPLSNTEVRHIMADGTDFLGAEAVKKVLGTEVKDSDIFFSRDELSDIAKNHFLFTPAQMTVNQIHDKFENKTLNGKRFLYAPERDRNENFLSSEIPIPGTRILSRQKVRGNNLPLSGMLGFQHLLIEHAKRYLPLASCSEAFKNNFRLAEEELHDFGSEIAKITKPSEAAGKIVNLASCKMFAPELSMIAQFAFLDNCVNGRNIFQDFNTWTRSLHADRWAFAFFGDWSDKKNVSLNEDDEEVESESDKGAHVYKPFSWQDDGNPEMLFSCNIEMLCM